MKYTLDAYHAALFPNDFYISNVSVLIASLSKIKEFDGDPLVLPLPSSAPRELPRLTIRSKDGTRTCQIGLDKLYFTWSSVDGKECTVSIDDISNHVRRVVESLRKGVTFNRVGFITDYVVDATYHDVMNSIFNSKLLDASESVTDFTMSVTRQMSLQSYNYCNRVVALRSGTRLDNPGTEVVAVRHDLNTQPNAQNAFDLAKVIDIIRDANEKSSLAEIQTVVCLE